MDAEAGSFILCIADDRNVQLAGEAVLRTEQRFQVDVLRPMQNLNGAGAALVNARVIGNETDAASLKLLEAVPIEHVDSG